MQILQVILNWLSAGPLKGYRTQILAVALGLLAAGRALGVLPAWLDQQTYDAVTTALTGAIGVTAAYKKPA